MLSIVIPVYNEEENLNSVIEELLENIDTQSPYEIIFVDDSSDDNTFLNVKAIPIGINKNINFMILDGMDLKHERKINRITGYCTIF